MHNFLLLIFCFFCFWNGIESQSATIFEIKGGEVSFTSDAPLELIEAKSKELRGLIDIERRTFGFSIPIASFEGFNSPLQREHFNENYLESNRFSNATFQGKIIESIDLSQNGTYVIRAKGKLFIHGVERERIIKSTVEVDDGVLSISSSFTVLLNEHEIEIPRIVFQKIAEEIKVALTGRLETRDI